MELEILHYNELDSSGLKSQLKKVEDFLRKGDFKSADVKKMPNTGYYRAKLDREDRLLFKFAQYQNKKVLLILEVIKNHAYEKSKFLRGAIVDENKLESVSSESALEEADSLPKLTFVNKDYPQFHLLDKVICFDAEQDEIYKLPTPLIIIGSAGSGKTALTLEKMKQYKGNILYVSHSPYLVENAQRIYYANNYENDKQDIDFLSFREYIESIRIPKGREVNFRDFGFWYSRFQQQFKFKEPYKLFEEFKGVLTGSVTEKAYLSRAEYIKLGVKQSIFLNEERERVYDLFEKYLVFLQESELYDTNMVAYDYLELVESKYDFVVVDEVQDLTNVQLMLILRALQNPINFVLSGDSNQIVHPNFFSWSKIKSLFFDAKLQGSALRILKTNYRNSQKITTLSNNLLKIKNARFGSIDKESTYLINTVSSTEGDIFFYEDDEKLKKELNKRTQGSTKFALLVMNEADKNYVRKYFDTPLLFSIQEAKGLEYENIILVNFISNNEKEFREVCRDISPDDLLDENMRYARSKDKADKDLEAYKFYVNSLYVAFTRAVKNIYIVETNKKSELLQLLGVTKTAEKVQVETQQSTTDEWLEEARRLELQGKHEQAQQIRDRLRGIEYLSPEQVEQLSQQVFSTEKPNPADCKKLFDYAQARFKTELIEQLYKKVNYGPAKQYMGEYERYQQTYFNDCLNNSTKNIQRSIEKFGINFRSKEGMTGLMIAVMRNNKALIDFFMKKEADIKAVDKRNRSVLQMVLLGFEKEYFNSKVLIEHYLSFSEKMPYIKNKTQGRLFKISSRTMEYFLVHYIMAVRDELFSPNDPDNMQGLQMDEFMEYIELMPEAVLPEYRRKRQYVNSILSKNEVERIDKYNKFLFKRKSRGIYNIQADAELEYE